MTTNVIKDDVKVFCLGLSRTGTGKLCHILVQLGFKTIHFVTDLFSPVDWDVLCYYDAFADSPVPIMYKECDARWERSKFILTTRSENGWLDSMRWMLSSGRILWGYNERINKYHENIYGTSTFNEKILLEAWRSYHEGVIEYFVDRPTDVLIIDIDNGFDADAICKFLEMPARAVDTDTVINRRVQVSTLDKAAYHFAIARKWLSLS